MLDRDFVFVVISVVCILNGLLSPAIVIAANAWPIWMPEFIQPTGPIILYGSSLIVSFTTLLVGGVPCALYERIAGINPSSAGSMLVWLAGVVVLSLPALQRIATL